MIHHARVRRGTWPLRASLTLSLLALLAGGPVVAAESSASTSLAPDFENQPTHIKADTLVLHSDTRKFEYSGNVEVQHGDMTLTSRTLHGTYSAQNEIEELVATGDVVIVKGESMRGTSQRATYDAATQIVTLTENPLLEQEGSTLAADVVKMFLAEDRSSAEGNVQVKLVQKTAKDQKEAKEKEL